MDGKSDIPDNRDRKKNSEQKCPFSRCVRAFALQESTEASHRLIMCTERDHCDDASGSRVAWKSFHGIDTREAIDGRGLPGLSL